ncbi:MAG: ATP-binding protein [Anaerolineae bacterium]
MQSPGDFLFFLVVMILNLISLLMSLALTDEEYVGHQRYTLALFGVVFAWSLMFAGVLFIRFADQSADTILPPLERAVSAASLLLLGWAFLTGDHGRWRQSSNTLLLILLLAVAIAYAVNGIIWIEVAEEIDFNLSNFGVSWTFVLFALPVLGILLSILFFRDIVDAPLKIVFFLLVGTGGALTIYQITQNGVIGNDMGLYRMTFTLAQVMIPLIIYRIVVAQYKIALEDRTIRGSTPIPSPQAVAAAPPPPPQRIANNDTINAQLLKAMGMMLESGDPSDIPSQIVNTLLDILRADIGALLRLQDINYADITVAQDRMMGQKIASMSLNLDNQPTLVNAIERHAQRGLYPDRNVEELDDLYERMYIEQRGPVYLQPLTHNHEVFAVILVAMPYTKRELRAEEVEILKGIGAISGSLLAVSYASAEASKHAEDQMIQAMVEGLAPSTLQESSDSQARSNMEQRLIDARAEIQNLNKQVNELNKQLGQEQNRIIALLGDSAENLSISQRISVITDEQIQLREEREQLARRLKEAEAALQGASAADNDSVISHLVETLRQEKEILEVEKIRLQQTLDEMRAQDKSVVPADMQRLLNRMMQEKNTLEQERNQLSDKLGHLETELQALGIEDDITGLSEWISRLSEERVSLKHQNELLQKERDTLLKERETFSQKIDQEKDRDTHIQSLHDKIEKLASDREIAVKQRDKLRAEYDEILKSLNMVKEHRARLLAESSGHELELTEAREEQAQLRAQIQELADLRSQLLDERDRLSADNTALKTELEQLQSQVDGDPSRMKRINEEGVGSLKEMIEQLSQQRDQLERQLNQVMSQRDEARQQLNLLQVTTAKNNGIEISYSPKEPELLVGLVQELRTPMTSITGYVDLLMSESVGILGETQRKFLQRVGSSITRMDSMLNSLIRVTQLDTGLYQLTPRPIDFVRLVENTITDASLQFREKGLAVILDLDEALPTVTADLDAMKQVIEQLLTNAYLVSPPDSDINVTVVRKTVRLSEGSDPQACIYVAIEDSGGGISPEDIPRVFARKYKAENPLIEGLGDTGVGMSIAKALIEAHEGKLWVETHKGEGSTFMFALPIKMIAETKED